MSTEIIIAGKKPAVYRRGLAHYYPALPDFITLPEAHAIFEAASRTSTRDYLLFSLLWHTGLRVSEALSLTLDSIRGTDIKVVGKGGKERYIPVEPSLINDLLRYAMETGITYHKRILAITRSHAHRLLNQYAVRAGIDRPLHCHLFRHGFAVNFLKQVPNLVYLQELLGHSSIETTRIYTRAALPDVRHALSQVVF